LSANWLRVKNKRSNKRVRVEKSPKKGGLNLNTSLYMSPKKKKIYTDGERMFRHNQQILEGVKFTMMKGILNMNGMGTKKVNRSSKKGTLWTVKSITDVSEMEEKFVNYKRMNFHFFSKELIYYTCEFCLLRCIFHHKFTKKFPVALKYLEKAIENAPMDLEPNNLNLMIKLNLYIAQMQREHHLPHLSLENLWKNVNLAMIGFSTRFNIIHFSLKPFKIRKLAKYFCINLMSMMRNFVDLDCLEIAFEAAQCLKWFIEAFFNLDENFAIVSHFLLIYGF
jgi:hypothetical protein